MTQSRVAQHRRRECVAEGFREICRVEANGAAARGQARLQPLGGAAQAGEEDGMSVHLVIRSERRRELLRPHTVPLEVGVGEQEDKGLVRLWKARGHLVDCSVRGLERVVTAVAELRVLHQLSFALAPPLIRKSFDKSRNQRGLEVTSLDQLNWQAGNLGIFPAATKQLS